MPDPVKTIIVPQVMSIAGLTLAFAACNTAGNFFTNNGRCFVYVKNVGGTAKRVAIVSQQTCSQGFVHSLEISIPATTGLKMIGVLDINRYNDVSSYVQITYPDGITDLSIALVEF